MFLGGAWVNVGGQPTGPVIAEDGPVIAEDGPVMWGEGSERLLSQSLAMSRGRADESSQPSPASVSFELDNPDGFLTPDNPVSPYWPEIGLGVLARMSVWWDDAWQIRMVGQVSEWAPTWPWGDLSDATHPGECRVQVTVSGLLRRLGQGTKRETSVMRDMIPLTPGTVAYWPMEDGSDAEALASATAGQALALVRPSRWEPAGSVRPGQPTGPPGTAGSVTLVPPIIISGQVTAAGPVAIDAWVEVPEDSPTWGATVRANIPGGFASFSVSATSASAVVVIEGVTVGSFGGALATGEGVHHLLLYLSGTTVQGWRDGQQVVSGTSSAPIGPVAQAGCQAGALGPIDFSHLVVTDMSSLSVADLLDMRLAQGDGLPGESAASRLERLCSLADIDLEVDGDPDETLPMGRQLVGDTFGLLAESAATDMGVLSEQRSAVGLRYRTRRDLYNQAPVLVLDAALSEIANPFLPVDVVLVDGAASTTSP